MHDQDQAAINAAAAAGINRPGDIGGAPTIESLTNEVVDLKARVAAMEDAAASSLRDYFHGKSPVLYQTSDDTVEASPADRLAALETVLKEIVHTNFRNLIPLLNPTLIEGDVIDQAAIDAQVKNETEQFRQWRSQQLAGQRNVTAIGDVQPYSG